MRMMINFLFLLFFCLDLKDSAVVNIAIHCNRNTRNSLNLVYIHRYMRFLSLINLMANREKDHSNVAARSSLRVPS